MAVVNIPTYFVHWTKGQHRLEIGGEKLPDILQQLCTEYPLLKPHILDDKNKPVAFISIFINDVDIRQLNINETLILAKDIIQIIPPMAGG